MLILEDPAQYPEISRKQFKSAGFRQRKLPEGCPFMFTDAVGDTWIIVYHDNGPSKMRFHA